MPDETRAIEPALALREWYDVKESDREALHEAAGVMMQAFMPNADEPGLGRTTSERLAACMALANVGLSKSDPRKITREDLRNVEDAIGTIMMGVRVETLSIQGLWDLAAKLAALLPPEG